MECSFIHGDNVILSNQGFSLDYYDLELRLISHTWVIHSKIAGGV